MAGAMIHNLALPQATAPNKRLVHFAGSRASTHSTPNPPCSHAVGKQENRLLGGRLQCHQSVQIPNVMASPSVTAAASSSASSETPHLMR